METPLISVIIPNYNHAPFLDERIQRLLSSSSVSSVEMYAYAG